VRAGAFDRLEANRARLLAGAELVLRRAHESAEARATNQIALFGGADDAAPLRLPDVAPWMPMEALVHEREAIGFHLTAHPLDAYAKALARLGVVPIAQIAARAASGAGRLRIAGAIESIRNTKSSRGTAMAHLRVGDGSGGCEVTAFSEVLTAARETLREGTMVVMTVTARTMGETLRLTIEEVEPLDRAAGRAGQGIRVWLTESASVPHIRALLDQAGRGRGRVVLVPRLADGAAEEVEIALPGGFQVTPRLAQALKVIPGVAQVEEV